MGQKRIDEHTLNVLEFAQVLELLAGFASSDLGRDAARRPGTVALRHCARSHWNRKGVTAPERGASARGDESGAGVDVPN